MKDPSTTPLGEKALKFLKLHPEGLTTQAIAKHINHPGDKTRLLLFRLGGRGWLRLQNTKPFRWFPTEQLKDSETF